MKSNILFFAIVFILALSSRPADAQTIQADNSLGITITLPKNQPNQMEVWVYDSTTTIKINNKYHYTQGIGIVHSNQFTIKGGDQKDEITIYGNSTKAMLNVYLNDGNDLLDCLLNRPLKAYGGNGHDTIWCGDQDDEVKGGAGNDEIHGRKGSDNLFGESGKDKLYGDAGQDGLLGGWGQDELYGGPDRDVLIGGEFTVSLGQYWNIPAWDNWMSPLPDYETDQLHGGEGSDYFVGEIYYWTQYFVYHSPPDWFYIWPYGNTQKIVVDKDTPLDFDSNEDLVFDFAIPKFPTFQFHGLPRLHWN